MSRETSCVSIGAPIRRLKCNVLLTLSTLCAVVVAILGYLSLLVWVLPKKKKNDQDNLRVFLYTPGLRNGPVMDP
jgi:hypothetical protein